MENIFIILLGLSMIYIASTSRLAAHINMLAAQGWLLFFVCLSGFIKEPWFEWSIFTNPHTFSVNLAHVIGLLFVIVETLIVKAFVIPWFLKKVLKKTNSHRDTDAHIPHFYCLVISSIILFAGFLKITCRRLTAPLRRNSPGRRWGPPVPSFSGGPPAGPPRSELRTRIPAGPESEWRSCGKSPPEAGG